jgi:hypothetical protein
LNPTVLEGFDMARFSKIAVALVLVAAIVPTLAYGQSACQQLGVNCTFRPSGGTPPRSNNNSGPSVRQQQKEQKHEEWKAHRAKAEQSYKKGDAALNAYLKNKTDAGFKEAIEAFKQAIANEDSYGPAWSGAVRLLAEAQDHEGALKWATAASSRAKFSKEASTRMHAWFQLVISQQKLAIDQGSHKHDCQISFGNSSGGGVDLTQLSLGTTLEQCKKRQKKLDETEKKVAEELKRYQSKYASK